MSTFVDETAGDVPVKDITLNFTHVGLGVQESLVAQGARARQAISRVSREELEDRFLRLHEENLLLKQHTHKQEDKIKRMATKLVRLVKDRRRVEQVAAGGVRPGARDVELEEMMEELQEKVRELQVQNEGLKQRLLAAKQQLQAHNRRTTPYSHVQSRVNTGLRRLREDTVTLAQLPLAGLKGHRSVEVETGVRPPQLLLPRYGHSLLDEARAEIRNLENVIETQNSHIEEIDRAAELLRDQLKRKEREFEESLLHMREQQTTGQRSTIKDNLEMIKLQKQLVEKGNAFTVLEGRFLQLQEKQGTLKASHDAVMTKLDELTVQLKEERLKSLDLERQLQANTFSQRRTEELHERILDLEKERELLKENCDKLVNSAFDVSQEQKFRTREQQLKLQIAQLELALKSDLTDKNEILDQIKVERDLNEQLRQENKDIQLRFLEQKQQFDEIQDKIKFYTKESEIDVAELSEALMLIKVRKTQRSGELGFLEQVEEVVHGDTEFSIKELQATHAETIQELEKTRNMLIVQHKINKDYQAEVEAVTRKMDDSKMEYELKLERLAQLLDMRAAKIKKLEAQLKNIAYGTKAHILKPDMTDQDLVDDFEETIHLERGENLLEIHIGTATLSPVALEMLNDSEPSTFCTYAFYDFELQSTPVLRGAKPAYCFTSQYIVKVDDLLLQYLHASSVTVELQLARGLEFQTIAAGQLRLMPLLENNGKVHGTVPLVGVAGEVQSFGSLSYWVRLRVPIEQAIRLYKERMRALGYISSALREENQALNSTLTSRPLTAAGGPDMNELSVTIHCCGQLASSRGPAHKPSPYVVYQVYDFPDHDTCIVADCAEPRFEDHMSFPVAVEAELDSYLKKGALALYVFDDQETQSEMYLGKAGVPLLPLAHDKAITGVFQLTDPSGIPSGSINVTLDWRFSYVPPHGSTGTLDPGRFGPKLEDISVGDHEGGRMVETEDISANVPLPDSQVPLPQPRLRTLVKDKTTSKKVSFVNENKEGEHVSRPTDVPGREKREGSKLPSIKKGLTVSEIATAPDSPRSTAEEDDAEDSHFSEGQVIAGTFQSTSDESEISEDILRPIDDVLETSLVEDEDQGESIPSDSDDCIVPGQSSMGRKLSERVRVEIVSLALRPESRAAADDSVVRLFVEYSMLDMPSEETPLALPKPPPGKASHYNYSNVIHVDMENNKTRRQMLRGILEGRNPQMESIRFTVVSEPPEEEEQEKECEDVGVAYFRIPDILEKQQDLIETSLNIVDTQDSSVVVGSLCVSVEGLEALQSIMEDPDHDYTALSSLEPEG
ncbi:protein fantom [Esox lucius]|uniref:C2 domain-containing protein n=1 Tax=Esox lucius TaxID=8010 RepID=A0A3P9ABB2_ESOLU|nr:protein fantom [Esox lucius]XP_010881537.2 protein fantom [Esox lucius]XP_010881538.2 protein fantom [Esox lucius]